jgi:hypothetical protein
VWQKLGSGILNFDFELRHFYFGTLILPRLDHHHFSGIPVAPAFALISFFVEWVRLQER